jgi:hypothetical protein
MSKGHSFIAQIAHSSSLFAAGVCPPPSDATLALVSRLRTGVLHGREEAITIPYHC